MDCLAELLEQRDTELRRENDSIIVRCEGLWANTYHGGMGGLTTSSSIAVALVSPSVVAVVLTSVVSVDGCGSGSTS